MKRRVVRHLLEDSDLSSEEEFDLMAIAQRLGKNKCPRKTYERSFKLENFDEKMCLNNFRFEKDDIPRLAAALQLPEFIETANRLRVNRVEALCILLRRLAYPTRLTDVGAVFGRHKADIGIISNTVLSLIHEQHKHRLSSLNQPWINFAVLSNKVREKGSPLERCFGFIDGTVRPIAHPTYNQREVYSGHKRVHALKFQSLALPNGIIGHMFGPFSGRRHDAALMAESGLLEELQRTAGDHYIYGDQAYPIRQHIISPYRGAVLTADQEAFNREMGKLRLCVEWGFGKIIQCFSFLDFQKNQKLLLQPIAKYYLVGTLLTNCHTCLYGSVTSSYFSCDPPTLEEYMG